MKNKTRTKKKTRIERRWPPSPAAVRSGGLPLLVQIEGPQHLPAKGSFQPGLWDLVLVVATGSPVQHALDDALADGGEPLAPRARAAPEEPGPIGEAHVREIDDRVHRHTDTWEPIFTPSVSSPWQKRWALPSSSTRVMCSGARNPSGAAS
jgi:hypothetical protein